MVEATIDSRATVRYLRVSPTKVRPVLGLIRGLPVTDAERTLQLCERGGADDVFKLLESAVANAGDVKDIPAEELYVARAWADEGPTRKWGRPRARGRYARLRKRTSHVTIELARFTEEELEELHAREDARGGPSADARRRRAERVARSRAAQADEDEVAEDEVAEDDTGVEAADETDVEAADETDVEAADDTEDDTDEDDD